MGSAEAVGLEAGLVVAGWEADWAAAEVSDRLGIKFFARSK